MGNQCRSQWKPSFLGIISYLVSYYVQYPLSNDKSTGLFYCRIYRYGCQTPCCFVSAIIYLEKLKQYRPGFKITPTNCQRCILLAIVISTKFYDDIYFRLFIFEALTSQGPPLIFIILCSNSVWSKIGGLSLQELNSLELEFLFEIRFNLFIHTQEYNNCVAQLSARTPQLTSQMLFPASAKPTTAHVPLCQPVSSREHVTAAAAAAAAAAAEESELSRLSTPNSSVETLAAGHHACDQAAAPAAAPPAAPHHWRRSACEQPAWWEAPRTHRSAARSAPAGPSPALLAPCTQHAGQPAPLPPPAAQACAPAPPPPPAGPPPPLAGPPPPLTVLFPEPEFWPEERSRRYRV
jgi:hypothetical protein